MTAYATIENAVEAIKKGADSYFVKGNDPEELVSEIRKIYETRKIRQKNLENKNSQILVPTSKNKEFSNLIEKVKKAAKSNVNILLLGESGVGKKFLQNTSIMKVKETKCPLLQSIVMHFRKRLESELFGHKKGSFTGAENDRIGRFESSDKGTLFLDEIADTPMSTQIKLLRVLDQRKYNV